MNLGKPHSVLIKTYTFDSGLWYLGLSLYQELTKNGFEVRFIPKSKYVKDSGYVSYQKKYFDSDSNHLDKILPMEKNLSISSQIQNYVKKYNVETLISLETLMESSTWIKALKRKSNIKIIDVPMLEWVSPNFLYSKEYQVFDQIWALTDSTYKSFRDAKHYQTIRKDWNYVDSELFYPVKKDNTKFTFYHQASLNSEYSSKNTYFVLEAFQKLYKETKQNVQLFLTGNLTFPGASSIIDGNEGIRIFKNSNRQDIANLYQASNCVLVPSSKEGLGLALFESKACGCQIITTDVEPMNIHSKYLCQVKELRKDKTLVPLAIVSSESIYQQMKNVYEDYLNDRLD